MTTINPNMCIISGGSQEGFMFYVPDGDKLRINSNSGIVEYSIPENRVVNIPSLPDGWAALSYEDSESGMIGNDTLIFIRNNKISIE